jgi:DUF438 domain-containing protein
MTEDQIKTYILDSIPYPIVFVDTDHIIRYMNNTAKHFYYTIRGYRDLVGKSLFECHGEVSEDKIRAVVDKLKNHANEIFLNVSVSNHRLYINPVRNEHGELVGYFERFEMNVQK